MVKTAFSLSLIQKPPCKEFHLPLQGKIKSLAREVKMPFEAFSDGSQCIFCSTAVQFGIHCSVNEITLLCLVFSGEKGIARTIYYYIKGALEAAFGYKQKD